MVFFCGIGDVTIHRWCPAEVGSAATRGRKLAPRFGRLLGLLGEKHSVDVGEHATVGDGHATEELVELLVVANG
jgi:hypothetical protein